jgi:hypothetical protein
MTNVSKKPISERKDLIERGQVFGCNNNNNMLYVKCNHVYIETNEASIQIGEIYDEEISYFGGNPLHTDKIVYLGERKFSYKRLWSPNDEFSELDEFRKNEILIDLLDAQINLIDAQIKLNTFYQMNE